MGAGQAKIELLLELRNRVKAGLSSARSQIGSGVNGMKAKLAELRGGASETLNSISSQIPGVGSAMGMLANPVALVTAGVLLLGATYVKASQKAMEWEKGMAKVNVTAQLTKKELATLSDQVMDIGARNSTPLAEVPDAFNKIVSAGLNAQDALAAFEPILKGSKAGFTELTTVAAATVSTMNSTGLKDATSVLDVLFATMNKGNAEFADIANYLPKIIPMAEKAGQSFKDTAGAFAYFTAQGFKSEQTATLLENTFKAISDPRITDGFKKIGVKIYDAHGQAKPLLTILSELQGKLKGLSSEGKNKIFQTIGADGETVTAIGAMLKDYGKLKEIIDFTNDSQGQLNEAIKNAQTPMDVWAVISNQVDQGMTKLGQTSLPMIQAIGQGVMDFIQYWKDLYNNSILFRDILSAIGIVFKWAWNALIFGVVSFINLFKWVISGFDNLTTAIFGAGNGFSMWYMKVKPYILWVYQYLEAIGTVIKGISENGISGIGDSFRAAFKEIKSMDSIKHEVLNEYKMQNADKKVEPLTGKGGVKPTPDGKGGKTTPTSKTASTTTGSASQIKNLTINMDAMIKMGDLVSKNPEMANMSKKELESWFMEMAARMLKNLETSYG